MKTQRHGTGFLAITLSALLVLSGCNMNWINIAVADIPVVLQIVTSILSIVAIAQGKGQADPNMIAEVQNIAAEAKNDLATAQSLINDYQKAAQSDKPTILGKIDAALSATQKDLQSILTAFHVKDSATQSAVAAGVGLALTTVMAIYSLLPAAPSTAMPTASHAKRTPPHQPPKPADLKANYNALVSADFPDQRIP